MLVSFISLGDLDHDFLADWSVENETDQLQRRLDFSQTRAQLQEHPLRAYFVGACRRVYDLSSNRLFAESDGALPSSWRSLHARFFHARRAKSRSEARNEGDEKSE
jgi:hypothetical protein